MKVFVVYILKNASRRTLYTSLTSRIGLGAFQILCSGRPGWKLRRDPALPQDYISFGLMQSDIHFRIK
jgi:hypothetical protein